MERRAFLRAMARAAAAVSYFDMGASWKKHGDLYLWDGIDRGVYPTQLAGLKIVRKKYYSDVIDDMKYDFDLSGYYSLVPAHG